MAGRGKGRRGLLRRELERSGGNIDKYLVHIKTCIEIVNHDNLPLEATLEELGVYAIRLQQHTKNLRDGI